MDLQGKKLGSSLSVGRFSVADMNTLEWWSVERLLVVGLVGIVTMFMFSQLFRGRKRNLPLGPRGLPIIGNIHQLRNDTMHITFMQMAEKYGPIIYLKLGSRGVVVAFTAETAHEFVKVQDLVWAGRQTSMAHEILTNNQMDIAGALYGPYWRHLRKICAQELFTSKSFRGQEHSENQHMEMKKDSRFLPTDLHPTLIVAHGSITQDWDVA